MSVIDGLMDVYANNLTALLAVAYTVVRNKEEAEDVVQNTVIKFIDNPQRVRAVEKPLPFLRTCVRNEAIDYLRKKGGDVPAFEDVLVSIKATAAEEEYKKIENLLYVRSYVSHMSPAFRDAFIRHVLDGWTIVSLAEELHTTPYELKRQFQIVKDRMRKDPTIMFTIYFSIFF